MEAGVLCATGFCVTVTCLCFTDALAWLRRKVHKTVECWFCQCQARVSYAESNTWTCQHCGQYNGFSQDGGYNRELPSMSDVRYNRVRYARPQPGFCRTHTLCHNCNSNQEFKIKQIANYVPVDPNNYDWEMKRFKQELEEKYKLCGECERLVSGIISSSLSSAPRKLLINKVKKKPFWTQYLSCVLCLLLLCHWYLELNPQAGVPPVERASQVLLMLGVLVQCLQVYQLGSSWSLVTWVAWTVIYCIPHIPALQSSHILPLQVTMTMCFLLSTLIILVRRKMCQRNLGGRGRAGKAATPCVGSSAPTPCVDSSAATSPTPCVGSSAATSPTPCVGSSAASVRSTCTPSRINSATKSASNASQYCASDLSETISPRWTGSGRPRRDSPVNMTGESKTNLMKPLPQLPPGGDLDISTLTISTAHQRNNAWSKTTWDSRNWLEEQEKVASPWDRVSVSRSSSLRSSPCSFRTTRNIISPAVLSNNSDDWFKSPSSEKEPYFKRLNDPWTPNLYDNYDLKKTVYPYPVIYSWTPPPWDRTSTPNSSPQKQEAEAKPPPGVVSHLPTIILATTNAFLVYYILNLKS